MKMLLGALIISATLLTGCTRQARLYDLKTGKAIPLTYTGAGRSKGQLFTTLESGEKLAGEWNVVIGTSIGWGNVYSGVYSAAGTASGSANGMSLATSGTGRGAAIMSGDKGTVMECEFISGFGGHGNGACRDNHEKMYKLMF